MMSHNAAPSPTNAMPMSFNPSSHILNANIPASRITVFCSGVMTHFISGSMRMYSAAVVLAKQVTPEITVEVAPDRVNVVGLVLGVVVFDQERWALYSIVVRLADLDLAGPGERDLPKVRTLETASALRGDLRRHAAEVLIDQFHEQRRLGGLQLSTRNSDRRERVDLV